MLKHLCRKQHQNNKIQTLRKKKQIEMNSPDFQKDEIIAQQKEWIERLLEYTEISKEDLKMLIDSEKDKAEIREKLSSTLGMVELFGGGAFFNR